MWIVEKHPQHFGKFSKRCGSSKINLNERLPCSTKSRHRKRGCLHVCNGTAFHRGYLQTGQPLSRRRSIVGSLLSIVKIYKQKERGVRPMDFHVPQTKTRSLGKSRIAQNQTAIPGHDL